MKVRSWEFGAKNQNKAHFSQSADFLKPSETFSTRLHLTNGMGLLTFLKGVD
jgi:hypothetical protein